MYGHNYNYLMSDYANTSADFSSLEGLAPPSALVIPAGNEFKFAPVGHSSSGCRSHGSPSSLASNTAPSTTLMQRSVSSHSLQRPNVDGFLQPVTSVPPVGLTETENSPVRRVFSAGGLQGINMVHHYYRSERPLSNESCSNIIESMNRACRYSPEEKKERIERYRSKRNQRNFNKKIKYACRKTLADSRPRIRGRFARNNEIEKSCQTQWNNMVLEEDDEDEDNWVNFLHSFSGNSYP